MQTINGKLIVEQTELERLDRDLKELVGKVEQSEARIIATSESESARHRRQLSAVNKSFQELERAYRKLLSILILSLCGSVCFFWFFSPKLSRSCVQTPPPKIQILPFKNK